MIVFDVMQSLRLELVTDKNFLGIIPPQKKGENKLVDPATFLIFASVAPISAFFAKVFVNVALSICLNDF